MRHVVDREVMWSQILRTWAYIVSIAQLGYGTFGLVVANSTQKGGDEILVPPLVLLVIGGATLLALASLPRGEAGLADAVGKSKRNHR